MKFVHFHLQISYYLPLPIPHCSFPNSNPMPAPPLRVALFTFLLCFIFSFPKAQLLEDKEGMQWVRSGIHHIYNFEFTEAEAEAARIRARYPSHPVTYLLKAFQMYWQYLPLHEKPGHIPEYRKLLNECLQATERQYGANSTDPEAVFFTMASHGYLAILYNYQSDYFKAVGEARKAYKSLLEGMKLTAVNPDFLFPSGMYNYYVIAYPETTPLVKPLMVFFKNGNKATGLQQLEAGTRKGVITQAEACFYLAHIYMEQESRPDKALAYTTRLRKQYPANPVFHMRYIETLLFNARYKEAATENTLFGRYADDFYLSAYQCFRGILSEHANDDTAAERYYRQALGARPDPQYTREYHAMAYAGLARISLRTGNKKAARTLYKKCLEHAQYQFLIREAKAGG